MYWSDIFYPGNSEKTFTLADCAKLKTLLADCFRAVNDLNYCIKENFPDYDLEDIEIQMRESLSHNCNIIIDRGNQIEMLLEEDQFDVEELMDMTLVKEINDLDKKLVEIFENLNDTKDLLEKIGWPVAFVVLVIIMYMGYVPVDISTTLGLIQIMSLIIIIVAVVSVGMDMVLFAIYGAFERYKLKRTLEEYARAVEHFESIAEMHNNLDNEYSD
ncbi:hypothetical protein CHS0354_000011 [Potamilus streckersoni]|uniref:Uncharacterized protein n=1 Tax=Potamilus streckersoni TaxID=2493646 RepID=A0AAE0RTU1_9BIVA|nr:hypothetical protein CHS0354_000011 [Potamilus streckersoni]